MSGGRNIRNLTLVGFMGTGKSSIGRLTAARLHFRFVDTDARIEEQSGMSIAEIFERHGEAVFREKERHLIREFESAENLVISTGGGLIVDPANFLSLRSHSLLACLWASPQRIWERVRHQAHRPLLKHPDPLGGIRELLNAREPFYRQADVLLNTEVRSLREVTSHVLHHFNLARREQL